MCVLPLNQPVGQAALAVHGACALSVHAALVAPHDHVLPSLSSSATLCCEHTSCASSTCTCDSKPSLPVEHSLASSHSPSHGHYYWYYRYYSCYCSSSPTTASVVHWQCTTLALVLVERFP